MSTKRILSLVLTLTLILGSFSFAFADTADNTNAKLTKDQKIAKLVETQFVQGDEKGNLNLDKKITRAEVATIASRTIVAKDIVNDGEGYMAKIVAKIEKSRYMGRFSDVPTTNWANPYVNVAAEKGTVQGYPNGLFVPGDNITNAEAIRIMVGLKGENPVAGLNWPNNYIEKARELGLLDGIELDFNKEANTYALRSGLFELLYNTIEDQLEVKVVNIKSVSAINSTTVEVAFEKEVDDVKALNFTIEGLAISNAVVKQTDKKVVVLTTAAQTGAQTYTVKLDDKNVGTFTGLSSVIPTSIKMESTSVQSKVGEEVTLKANIGQAAAGVKVTFNIDAPAGSLNEDRIVEVLTNAEGIASYTYTQYAADTDTVAVYPTGAPTLRDFVKVYWGVQSTLTLKSTTTETTVNNGTAKYYNVELKDPKTGAALKNAELNVTFAENIDAPTANDSNAVVTDLKTGTTGTPFQSTTGEESVTITTDSNGKAGFTVTGTNTKVTPIVFADDNSAVLINAQLAGNDNNRLDNREIKAESETVTFQGAQIGYSIEFDKNASFEGVIGKAYTYKVTIKNASGQPYSGGTVKVAFDENIDSSIATSTDATITGGAFATANIRTLTLDTDGKGEFSVSSNKVNDTATPVVWIDQNNAGASQNVKEDTEPQKLAGSITFRNEVATQIDSKTNVEELATLGGVFATNYGAKAQYQLELQDQSGAVIVDANTGLKEITYTVTNTGNETANLTMSATPGVTLNATSATLAAGNSITVKGTVLGGTFTVKEPVLTIDNANKGKISVSASTITQSTVAKNNNIYLTAPSKTLEWVNAGSAATATEVTGTVVGFNTVDNYAIVKVDGSSDYKVVTYTTTNLFQGTQSNFASLTSSNEEAFEKAISLNDRLSANKIGASNERRLINVDNSSVSGQYDQSTPLLASMVSARAISATQLEITFSEYQQQ